MSCSEQEVFFKPTGSVILPPFGRGEIEELYKRAGVVYYDNRFLDLFSGLQEEEGPEQEILILSLVKPIPTLDIFSQLGGEEAALIKLGHFLMLLQGELRRNLQPHPPISNLAFIRGQDDRVYCVSSYWCVPNKGWGIQVVFLNESRWYPHDRIVVYKL